MLVREKRAKTILSESKVHEYTINPYVGCEHGCTYCYARFIRRFTGHREAWGDFVDVKVNAIGLLEREVGRKRIGRVWISGICDPYQPIEEKYQLTRGCLRILSRHGWPATIQTKSPLVLRDLDLLRAFKGLEVVFTVTTADDGIRKIFEPKAPSIEDRIRALERLSSEGIGTCAMIAPILPGAEGLPKLLRGIVRSVLIDRMNYHYADWVYRRHGLEYAMKDVFFSEMGRALAKAFRGIGIPCEILF
ncbi:MAG: radical SAM protein [Candidatus Bathyarchaeia archaeon]